MSAAGAQHSGAEGHSSTILTGSMLLLAGAVLAVSNFMVVLDTTIANVSVAHIAGGLGISSSEGTWVITSYAVAEAICVPLTGWLSKRLSADIIVQLAIIAIVGFASFLIWELTHDKPVVDLRPFRHRGFTVSVIALVFAYGTFFASLVVIPQWLQGAMGYTATWAGYATAFNGVAAVLMAPIVAKRMTEVDPRRLVFIGVLWLGGTSLLRVFWWNSGADFWTLALPQLIQGAGMPFFFVPLTTIALGAVDEEETASAAGVMNFLRTMAGAVAVAISTTLWYDGAQEKRDGLSGVLHGTQAAIDGLMAKGYSLEQARQIISQMVDKESVALATGQTFVWATFVFAAAASIIWLAPRPTRAVDTSSVH